MSLQAKYPKANTTTQWIPSKGGGGKLSKVEKLVLHTTETTGWPGYPSFAPHLTYNPWTHSWRQHFPLTQSATTLADPGSTGVQENRDNVIQVEIIAYCDPKYNKPGKGIDFIDDRAVQDLADFTTWLHDTAGLELKFPKEFLRYPSSYGNSKVRLSGSQYDAIRGIIGHQHVSGNDHGDPGNPPWLNQFLEYSKKVTQTALDEEEFIMAVGNEVWLRRKTDQIVKPGKTQVQVNEDKDVSVIVGENKGVDLYATVRITGLLADEIAWVYFSIIDVGKTGDKVKETRTGVQARGFVKVVPTEPAGSFGQGTVVSQPVHVQTVFKGDIPKPSAKDRNMRLRLVVENSTDHEISVNDVEIAGWKL